MPSMEHARSCDLPYQPLHSGTSSVTESHCLHRLESFDTEDGRLIRQRSNPDQENFGSPLPTPSPSHRRRSYIPGISRDRLATVVSESVKLNGVVCSLQSDEDSQMRRKRFQQGRTTSVRHDVGDVECQEEQFMIISHQVLYQFVNN